jgi:peptidoglycan/LPS O-acetylase OafA/YrhL
MRAFIVLFVLPVLIGVASQRLFRDTTRATLAATLAAPAVMYLCLHTFDPTGTWNWLATLLVSPLVIALALASVLLSSGRPPKRRGHPSRLVSRA